MKRIIVAIIMLFSLSAFAAGNFHAIEEAGPQRCWAGNCKIIVENQNITQECDVFCNFYCYEVNYQIECDGNDCWNTYDIACRTDNEPHQVCGH
jgi:hypothetical protein